MVMVMNSDSGSVKEQSKKFLNINKLISFVQMFNTGVLPT